MVELEPGTGPHLFRYRGRWFLLTREEHERREHRASRTRLRFFPGETTAAEAFAAALDGRALTMADLQGILLSAETGRDAVASLAAHGERPVQQEAAEPAASRPTA